MRKQPRQARSKATVGMIVDAAARILSEQGWAGFTTNKVADKAGVSIGSYYQYFPNKQSLIDAIRDRHLENCLAVLKTALERDLPLRLFVEALVDDIISIHTINPSLHRVLLDEAPSAETFRDPNSAFEKAYLDAYRAAFAKYRGGEDEIAGVIISDAIDGVVHNAARRGSLTTAAVRTALVRLITSYLSAPPSVREADQAARFNVSG